MWKVGVGLFAIAKAAEVAPVVVVMVEVVVVVVEEGQWWK